MSKCSAKVSTTLPLPSSPHWAPTTTTFAAMLILSTFRAPTPSPSPKGWSDSLLSSENLPLGIPALAPFSTSLRTLLLRRGLRVPKTKVTHLFLTTSGFQREIVLHSEPHAQMQRPMQIRLYPPDHQCLRMGGC